MKTSCKLLLSLLLSFSFLFVSVFADEEDYGISVLSIADENYLGYISLVNTGSNEWDSLISLIDSWNPDSFNNYIIAFDDDSRGRLMVNVTPGESWSYKGGTVYQFECSDMSTGCVVRSGTASTGITLSNSYILAMSGLEQNNYYSDIVNWNAINWTQAKALYENSDSEGTTLKDVIEAIEDGTVDSQESADIADDTNAELKDVIDEYDSIEQSYISDFNTNLDNIDVGGFVWDSSFLTSASWVTDQFNELVMETPFENLITFSLIIGITLYLIGRYKG